MYGILRWVTQQYLPAWLGLDAAARAGFIDNLIGLFDFVAPELH